MHGSELGGDIRQKLVFKKSLIQFELFPAYIRTCPVYFFYSVQKITTHIFFNTVYRRHQLKCNSVITKNISCIKKSCQTYFEQESLNDINCNIKYLAICHYHSYH